MAAHMAGKYSILARSNVMSLRQAIPCRHAPNLRKKTKQPDMKKKKKTGEYIHPKSREIVPPEDPEAFLNPYLLEATRQRQHTISAEEKEKQILLEKEWARFKMGQHKDDLLRVQRLVKSREDALKELKKCSIFLYEEAVKMDKDMFPFTMKGPSETPPIQDYFAPEPDTKKTQT